MYIVFYLSETKIDYAVLNCEMTLARHFKKIHCGCCVENRLQDPKMLSMRPV